MESSIQAEAGGEKKICRGGGGGFLLPLSDDENSWPDELRAVLYLFVMIYFFLGVSIVADIFMGSIEVITSRRRQIPLSSGRMLTVRVWNDTVANLTLMALGSSAPEILLAVTELFKRRMYAGDLGPSTIVGSASFNLLVIMALCIFVIPPGETRRVREMPVFIITVVFMFFAYLWVYLTVSVISPDIIELGEAAVTLLCLPLLVLVSYLADIGMLGQINCFKQQIVIKRVHIERACEILASYDRRTRDGIRIGFNLNPSFIAKLKHPSKSDISELRTMVTNHGQNRRSRAVRRIEATRLLTGSQKVDRRFAPTFRDRARISGLTGANIQDIPLAYDKRAGPPIVQFACESHCMSENLKEKPILLVRTGSVSEAIKVDYVVQIFAGGPRFSASMARQQSPSMSDIMSRQISNASSQNRRGSNASFASFASHGGTGSKNAHNSLSGAIGSFQKTSGSAFTHLSKSMGTQTLAMGPVRELNSYTGSLVFDAFEDRKSILVPRPDPQANGEVGDFAVEIESVDIHDTASWGQLSSASGPGVGHVNSASSSESQSADAPMPQHLGSMKTCVDPNDQRQVGIGQINRTYVISEQSGAAGKIGFAFERVMIGGTGDPQILQIIVQRQDGCSGKVSCAYRTERLTAIPNYDYVEADGELVFDDGVTEQVINLEILPKSENESKDEFLLVLEDLDGGASFDENGDGGETSSILTISIAGRNLISPTIKGRVIKWLDNRLNFDEFRLGNSGWKKQLRSAIFVGGSLEAQQDASQTDWVFHLIALPWKVVTSSVPPTSYCSGWLCFWSSLLFVGILTAIIGDLAELFGCVLGLPDIVTAITFVALGTSMPDLFASKSAATQDPFADASIVNVTGSNSVNVFLGLGLPWTIGALYWRSVEWSEEWAKKYPSNAAERIALAESIADRRMAFVYPSGDLGFSVSIFTLVAVLAVAVLLLRRCVVGAELGGPFAFKVSSSCCMLILWIVYILLSSWWADRGRNADDSEKFKVFAGAIIAVVLSGFIFIFYACREYANRDVYVNFQHSEDHLEENELEEVEVKEDAFQLERQATPHGFASKSSSRDNQSSPVAYMSEIEVEATPAKGSDPEFGCAEVPLNASEGAGPKFPFKEETTSTTTSTLKLPDVPQADIILCNGETGSPRPRDLLPSLQRLDGKGDTTPRLVNLHQLLTHEMVPAVQEVPASANDSCCCSWNSSFPSSFRILV